MVGTVSPVLSLVSYLFRLLFARLSLLIAAGDQRDAEILALRHQIRVLQRQVQRPRITPTDRAALGVLAKVLDRRRLDRVMLIVKPDGTVAVSDHLVVSRLQERRSRL